jgi:hypothetical protein
MVGTSLQVWTAACVFGSVQFAIQQHITASCKQHSTQYVLTIMIWEEATIWYVEKARSPR